MRKLLNTTGIASIAFSMLLGTVFITASAQSKSKKNMGTAPTAQTGYAPVNGLKLYYEVHGSGRPLVLLHGSFMSINTAFGKLIPELSKNRKVIAVDLQGHGRTADIDRPFSFEYMADDVAALLKLLKLDSADVFGYSLGGSIALQLAIRNPQLVRKLVIASSVYKFEGWLPETRAVFPNIAPEWFEGSPIKKEYDSIAPDPKHWAQMVSKLKQLITSPYDFTTEKIRSITSPILIVMGDADGVQPEHALEIYRLHGGGKWATLQGYLTHS